MLATKSPVTARIDVVGGVFAARERGADVIVGHRLPGGQLRTHAPGVPCTLCEASIHSPRLYRAG